MNSEIQVGMGLTIDKFQEGLKSASRDITSFTAKLKSPIAAITGLGASLAGIGVVSQIQSVSDYAEKIRNMADALNVGTTELQKFYNALSYSGVGSDVANKALTKFTANLNEAASGAGDKAAAFANMGIAIADTEGKVRPTMEILGELADTFANMEDKSQRGRIAVELFGKQGLKLVSALSQGRDEMERLGEIKQVISPEALETLDKMGDDISEVFNSIKGTGAGALASLGPVVETWKAAFFGLKGSVNLAADALYSLFNLSGDSIGERVKAFAGVMGAGDSDGSGLKTDKQRKNISEAQAKAIQGLVKASKEQAAFEKEALKIRMENASTLEKISLLEEKSSEQTKKVAELKAKGRTDHASALKAVEAETVLLGINADLEKARNSAYDEATKKRIQSYTDEADAQERINRLHETAIDLTRALNEAKERGTKTTVKEMAQQTATRFDSPERRKAIETAKQIAELERQQEQARVEGRAKDAAKLQAEALKLRGGLSADIFQTAEIKPFASIEEKLAEAEAEKKRLAHIRAMDKQLEDEAKQAEITAKRREILERGGEKVQGPGLFLSEEMRGEFAALADKSANDSAEASKRIAAIEAEAIRRIETTSPSTPESEAEFAKQLALAEELLNATAEERAIIQAAEAVPTAPPSPEADIAFNQMLMDTSEMMNAVGQNLSQFSSDGIEEQIQELRAELTQRGIRARVVNGP